MNIHEYPTNAKPLELARYQVAVMEAHEKGAIIECNEEGLGWLTCCEPHWYWKDNVWYRVQKPNIAAGHNLHGLTEADVNVKDGYRLLTKDEISCGDDRFQTSDIEKYHYGQWDPCWKGNSPTYTYRTKKPAGFFLSQKVALGHNLQNITEAHVNTAAGYRLLTKEEIEDGKHRTISYDIECLTITKNWYAGWAGDSLSCTYRTNKPVGFFLKPKEEYVAWTFDTAPKGTVLLQISPDMMTLITIWGVDKVGCGAIDISYQRLFEPNVKYSIDNGVTWNLCRTKKL